MPTDFLDLVVARDDWSRADLARLLGISDDDAVGMLSALGYEPVDPVGRTRWIASKDSDATALRTRILRDYMHRREGQE